MIKYDNSVCVRMNDTLKNQITTLCNETNINQADYVRARLKDCVINDVENLERVKREFMYG